VRIPETVLYSNKPMEHSEDTRIRTVCYFLSWKSEERKDCGQSRKPKLESLPKPKLPKRLSQTHVQLKTIRGERNYGLG
jgi:hypothetical protein